MSENVFATVKQQFNATAEQVFDAWTTPDIVRRWLQAALQSMGLSGEVKQVEIDAQLGGKFLFSDMRIGIEARHWGTYIEFERPSRLSFTWMVHENDASNPSKVRVLIEPTLQGCVANLEHEMDARWAAYVPRTEAGWSAMLKAIATIVER